MSCHMTSNSKRLTDAATNTADAAAEHRGVPKIPDEVGLMTRLGPSGRDWYDKRYQAGQFLRRLPAKIDDRVRRELEDLFHEKAAANIRDLIHREEAALPHVHSAAEALRRELDAMRGRWIEAVLKHAAGVGLDNNKDTWQALRRASARANGEAFDVNQVAPDWRWLRRCGHSM
ncbi:hypothetical protein VTJ49DRAFT_3183 [Mycothermus thermophilus]|uniref:Uncharacterized protein n=1 Tax=Humicola insolens TaxID=85995 RepID=A0ABR3VPF0_HUMIN